MSTDSNTTMFDSQTVQRLWTEFRGGPEYRQALQWAGENEHDGALFITFRGGLWAAIFAMSATKNEQAEALQREVEDLRLAAARYELVRTLTARQFVDLWERNLSGEQFDSLVDDALASKAEVPNV